MATLDDKLLGEKLHYYCSSSEDEGDDEDGRNTPEPGPSKSGTKAPKFIPEAELPPTNRYNTGPKGVIEDWRRFKQLERENRDDAEAEKKAVAKRLAMTCRTDKEDEAAKARDELLDEDLEALLDDDVLNEYMEKRMREMMSAAAAATKHFGTLNNLEDGEDFLRAIDGESEEVMVAVGVYVKDAPGCSALIGCLDVIAKEHPYLKVCKILASAAGLSKHFKSSGVPALLVYKAGDMVTSFVSLAETLGEDFYVSDLEGFLTEHGVLKDKELVPDLVKKSGIRSSAPDGSDSD